MSSNDKAAIKPAPDGPYMVKNLKRLSNKSGAIDTKETMAFCRCGGSANKPFCDGTHKKNGFSSAKLDGRVPDKLDDYKGKKIVVHDNRGVCAHAGRCTDGLPSVFRMKQEPWIDAQQASAEEIMETIRKCPSGALSYSVEGVEQQDQDTDPAVFVSPNGPYVVTGGPELLDTQRGEGASTQHFTLCRCGGSKNKPFCDGTHWYIKFRDDKN